jgi:TolB protein
MAPARVGSRLLAALLIPFFVATLRAEEKIEIIKTAGEANPSLVLTRFEGSEAVRKRLVDTLTRCDWFAVQASAKDPDYSLAARHTPGGQETIDMQVVSKRGGTFSLRGTAAAGRTDEAIYRAVDELLRKAFSVPGLCSSRLAFAMAGSGNLKEIYTCRFDGSDVRRLTHNGSISTEPAWGGGQLLVYTLYQSNATSVVLVDVANDRQKRLSRFPGLNAGADLSPDNQWAAITLSKDRRVDLFILSAQTGQVARQLTSDLSAESSPCWSPRGDQICYVSDRAGRPQLFIIPAGGGSPSRLLRESEETVSPDWSPVSNQICFAARQGNQYAIGVVDMSDSSRQRRIVTNAAGSWESPSWAPDGRHVVCSRRNGSRSELYMVDTWHGRLIPITQGGSHSLPSWSEILP